MRKDNKNKRYAIPGTKYEITPNLKVYKSGEKKPCLMHGNYVSITISGQREWKPAYLWECACNQKTPTKAENRNFGHQPKHNSKTIVEKPIVDSTIVSTIAPPKEETIIDVGMPFEDFIKNQSRTFLMSKAVGEDGKPILVNGKTITNYEWFLQKVLSGDIKPSALELALNIGGGATKTAPTKADNPTEQKESDPLMEMIAAINKIQ